MMNPVHVLLATFNGMSPVERWLLAGAIVAAVLLAGKTENPKAMTPWNIFRGLVFGFFLFGLCALFLTVGITMIGLVTGAIP